QRGRGVLRAGGGGRVPARRGHRPGGRGDVRARPQGHPAHVQERGDLAQQGIGGHHAGRVRGVLPRSGRTGDGGVLRARRRAGRGEDRGDRSEVRPGDTAAPRAV
ncbi:MAG: hypothetical protein AVDCRST_MAG12-1497, partial [uncultured Rubrobacteraceae bacterium]